MWRKFVFDVKPFIEELLFWETSLSIICSQCVKAFTLLPPPTPVFISTVSLLQLYHEETDENTKADPPASSPSEECVRLTRLYQFARNVRALLHTYHYNQIFLTEFLGAFNKFTGCCLEPRSYGYASTDELLGAVPQVRFCCWLD